MEEKQNFQTSLDSNQNIFKPSTREEIVEIVKNCYKKSIPLEISGLQSKNKIGRNFQAEKTLDLSNYKGIIDYKPEELYIKVKAGTPISEIEEALKKCEEFGADILKYCVKVGGALTGEHGVGIEKRELMCEAFNDKDIQQQLTIKVALDPNSLLNPGKVYPILRKCAEEGRVHVHGGKTKFPDIPRF